VVTHENVSPTLATTHYGEPVVCYKAEGNEPIAFTTEMTPKVDGGESLFLAKPRLQRSTMRGGEDK
jgi:hypothetical protein